MRAIIHVPMGLNGLLSFESQRWGPYGGNSKIICIVSSPHVNVQEEVRNQRSVIYSIVPTGGKHYTSTLTVTIRP